MLPRFARAELRVGGSPRAKFLWKIFILRGEWRRREIRPPKVCVFHLSVNQYCRENTLQNGSNFGSLPHPYTSISGWILPHVFLHYPKDPRNAFRWDLNILLNCGVPYPAVSCSACGWIAAAASETCAAGSIRRALFSLSLSRSPQLSRECIRRQGFWTLQTGSNFKFSLKLCITLQLAKCTN